MEVVIIVTCVCFVIFLFTKPEFRAAVARLLGIGLGLLGWGLRLALVLAVPAAIIVAIVMANDSREQTRREQQAQAEVAAGRSVWMLDTIGEKTPSR